MTYFLLQRVFTLENGVRLNNYQSSKLNIDPQITPPEFTQTLNPSPTHYSKLSFRRYKILEEIAQKHKSVNSF
ncbi:MAG: peptidoglycan-binding protein, partial [Aphanizomenon sp.]